MKKLTQTTLDVLIRFWIGFLTPNATEAALTSSEMGNRAQEALKAFI